MKKFWKEFSKNQSGFSFVELLVAFAIMAGIMGISAFSLGLPAGTQAKEVAYNLDAMLSRTKTGTLMKTGDVFMVLRMDAKNQVVLEYYENGKLKEWDTLTDPDKVAVHYQLTNEDGSTITAKKELDSSKALCISFNRRTTGFEKLSVGAGMYSGAGVTESSTDYCRKIYISASTVEYTLELGHVTGTHVTNFR